MFARIVHGTPPWVFALFLGLLALGIAQTGPRLLPRWRVCLMPGVMATMAVLGVLSAFGPGPLPLAAFALGVCALFAIADRVATAPIADYLPQRRRFRVAGSPWPLAAMLGLFALKYAVAVGLVLRPASAQDAGVVLPVCFAYGLGSGFFLHRTGRVLRAGA